MCNNITDVDSWIERIYEIYVSAKQALLIDAHSEISVEPDI